MRNPNRTTKGERRSVRRYNPYAARILGVAQAARWYREGVLLDEASGFDNLVNDLMYGAPPADLVDRTMCVIEAAPTYTTATGYDVGPDGWINAHYPMHVSTGIDVRQLEPGEWQEMVDAVRRAPGTITIPENLGGSTFAVPHLSEPRPQVVPESWVTIEGAEGGQWFAKYQAYREGREAGEEYLKWNGDPWHDPNEVAAVHAEAIEDALNDDIDPGDEQP